VLTAHEDCVHGLAWVNEHVVFSGSENGRLIAHDIRSKSAIYSVMLPELVREAIHLHQPGTTGDDFMRSICCLATFTSEESTLEKAFLAIGSISGHLTLLQNNRLFFDTKLHHEDIRSVEILSHTKRKGLITTTDELDILTSSYDTTGGIWKFIPSTSNLGHSENMTRFADGHTDKALTAVVVKKWGDVITTGADGRVILWSSQL
jgi:hypothetical protein